MVEYFPFLLRMHGLMILMEGTDFVSSQPIRALFDLGAIHSFISRSVTSSLVLALIDSNYILYLATFSGKVHTSMRQAPHANIVLSGRKFQISLFFMDIDDFNLILRMDSLYEHHVIMDYRKKKVIISHTRYSEEGEP